MLPPPPPTERHARRESARMAPPAPAKSLPRDEAPAARGTQRPARRATAPLPHGRNRTADAARARRGTAPGTEIPAGTEARGVRARPPGAQLRAAAAQPRAPRDPAARADARH